MVLRIAFSILATILLLPCLGFGVYGYLHARGEAPTPYWSYAYLVFDLVLIGGIVAAWVAPFVWFKGPKPGCCVACGQHLGPNPGRLCPECGEATGH